MDYTAAFAYDDGSEIERTGGKTFMAAFKIEPPYYPIVYVRGYAMTAAEREEVFHDAYYGFGATSVEKRDSPTPGYFEADVFEGLLIRLLKDHLYVDASNEGLRRGIEQARNPSRALWVSRFYDQDFFKSSIRPIEDHANELLDLILNKIPKQLADCDFDPANYKVILLAHSMGGLVCRTLIQNLLPKAGKDPKSVIHRFVTMGTPHGGIDLGSVPDLLEDTAVKLFNPFDANMFKPARMRGYLNLKNSKGGQVKDDASDDEYLYDIHSLGPEEAFPVKRCLCIIGSDWASYGMVRKLTGAFSDGLVKQDRAYLVSGPRPDRQEKPDRQITRVYDDKNRAYWANVHRAHSGYRGIVNSYESYENIQRFLFGDTIFGIDLDKIDIRTVRQAEMTYMYDFEFLLAIRGTVSYLHRREQNPCENAIRVTLDKDSDPPKKLSLHTGFMNKKLRAPKEPFSHFRLTFRVVEYRVKSGLLWDHSYPPTNIYQEQLEARIGDNDTAQFRWLSDLQDREADEWQDAKFVNGEFRIRVRRAKAFGAELVVWADDWPRPELTADSG